jgi:AraC-like DNA-binding protein
MNRNIEFHPGTWLDKASFERHWDLYSGGSTLERDSGAYYADIRGMRLPRMLMFERRLGGILQHRDPKRVARDDFTHLTLQVVLEGTMKVVVESGEVLVGAGEAILFDNAKPQQTVAAGVHLLSLAIARDAVVPHLHAGRGLHGFVFGQGNGAELIGYARNLWGRSADSSHEVAKREALALGKMLGESLVKATELAGQTRTAVLSGLRGYARVVAFVDNNARDPTLKMADIAAGSGVSRSALYRLFEPVGGVADFVLRQRLLLLRQSLHVGNRLTIADLAANAGFNSSNHAVRRFRTEFGTTPLLFRKALNQPEAETATDRTASNLPPWYEELL